jgi:thiol-disulfide isomerase/thioredoxin
MTRERFAGLGLLGALGVLLVWNGVTIGEHARELRPHGAGDLAPQIALRPLDVDGPRALADLAGRVVLIDFWATWCAPCRQSMPAIERLWQKHRAAGLEVVSINVENDGPKARGFAARFKPQLTFPLYLDDGPAQAAFHVDAIPQLVLVDKQGKIALLHVGGVDEPELDERISDALAR